MIDDSRLGVQTEEEEFEFEKSHFLAVMPEKVLVPLPNAEVPELISMVVDGILKASDLSNDEAQVRRASRATGSATPLSQLVSGYRSLAEGMCPALDSRACVRHLILHAQNDEPNRPQSAILTQG